MQGQRRSFRELFESVYRGDQGVKSRELRSLIEKSGFPQPSLVGHPDYEYLQIGETEPGTIVAFFMDVRGFTKLAIALDNREVVRILQATLAASIYSIAQFGGHTADLTGDGVMALFGGRDSTDSEDAYQAVSAAAFLMRGIKDVVRDYLESQGYSTVRVGMGLEYGEVLWTRLGLPEVASQVKPISGVSFLAGKLCTGKYTHSWECKIGQNLAAWLPEEYREKAGTYSFEHEGRKYNHDLYLFGWESFYRDSQLPSLQLEHFAKARSLSRPTWPRVTSGAGVIGLLSGQRSASGPRPLKDQPFFSPSR